MPPFVDMFIPFLNVLWAIFFVSFDLVVVPTVQILTIFSFGTAPSLTIFNFSSQPGIRAKPGFSQK